MSDVALRVVGKDSMDKKKALEAALLRGSERGLLGLEERCQEQKGQGQESKHAVKVTDNRPPRTVATLWPCPERSWSRCSVQGAGS